MNDDETLAMLAARISDEAFSGAEVILLDTKNLEHMDTPSTRCKPDYFKRFVRLKSFTWTNLSTRLANQ